MAKRLDGSRIKMKLGMEVDLALATLCYMGTGPPLPKRGTAPNFRPVSVVAKRLDGLPLGVEEASAQATLC